MGTEITYQGSIAVVGTGPGSPEHITCQAKAVIEGSDTVVGYRWYVELIRPLLSSQSVHAFDMGEERERAERAVDLAYQGHRVALVSGGDAGIYGMAGNLFERLIERGWSRTTGVPVQVVPGVTAATACAALLGSPLMQDFAVISLSDRFVPWAVIAKRLESVASSDMVMVLYEPASHLRPHQIQEAQRLILRHRGDQTPVGIVRDAFRPSQQVVVTSLGEMLRYDFDMRTVVLIGNSTTYVHEQVMITPRAHPGVTTKS